MVASMEAVRAIAAVCHLAPQVNMLFMGEEWAAAQPFPFFCDFGDDLSDAVRTGRLKEFSRFPQFADESTRARIPDPTSEATFRSAKLVWADLLKQPHQDVHGWYRRLLRTRRQVVTPLLPGIGRAGQHEVIGDHAVSVRWVADDGSKLFLRANLKAAPQGGFSEDGEVFWREGQDQAGELGPWSVCWSLTKAHAR
jgi:1,4-alpha-glucan branching enzyme